MSTTIYDEMVRAVAGGVSVVPINRATKKPHSKLLPTIVELNEVTGEPEVKYVWKPFQSELPSAEQMAKWRGAQAFAAVCGAVSGRGKGGRLVLDFDEERFYDAWVPLVGELADGLPVCRTQGGGYHVAMICPEPGGNEKLAWVPDDAEEAGRRVAIETRGERGERGYAVMPPSPGPDGVYALLSGCFVDVPVVSQARADALLAAARKLDEAPYTRQELESAVQVPTATDRARPSLNGQADVIDTFNERNPLRNVLRSFGYTDAGKRMLRPGASSSSEAGVTFTKRDGREIAFCHSSNDPLHGKHAHDAFSVYCTLKHGGDFRKAVHAAAVELGMDHKTVAEKPKKAEANNGLLATLPAAIAASEKKAAPMKLPDAWVPFPIDDGLPPVLADFVREADEALQVDATFVISPLLACLGAAIGNTAVALLKSGFPQPPLLWTSVVAPSGEGKSPGQKEATSATWRAQQLRLNEYHAAMDVYLEAQAKYDALPKAERGQEKPPERPELQHVLITDATTEAIGARLNTSPRGLVSAPDELAGMLRSFNAYKKGGGDQEAWLSFYDAGSAKIDRKTAAVGTMIIPRAFVALTGGVQPAVLSSILNDEHFDNGLAARFLLVMPPGRRRTWNEDVVRDATRTRVAELFANLFELPLVMDEHGIKPKVLPLTPDAKRVWGAWYNEVEAERDAATEESPYVTALPKVRSAAVRIALILQLVSHFTGEKRAMATCIDATSMSRGVTIARWYKREQKRVYDALAMSRDDRRVAKLMSVIRSMGGAVSLRDWQRKRTIRTSEAAELELQEIIDRGHGHWTYEQNPNGGRPRKSLTLNDKTSSDDTENGSNVSQSIESSSSANSLSEKNTKGNDETKTSNTTPSDTDKTPDRGAENEGNVNWPRQITGAEVKELHRLGYGDIEVINMPAAEFWRIYDGRLPKSLNPTEADEREAIEAEASVVSQDGQPADARE